MIRIVISSVGEEGVPACPSQHSASPDSLYLGEHQFHSSTSSLPQTPSTMPEPFDTKQYIKHLSYHQCLLFASFVFLPRSGLKGSTAASQRISLDRPEHPFLTPITYSPIRTMLFYLLGAVVCAMLWGQHLRTWAEGSLRSKIREERVQRTIKVSNNCCSAMLSDTDIYIQRLQDAAIATLTAIPTVFALLYILGAPWQ